MDCPTCKNDLLSFWTGPPTTADIDRLLWALAEDIARRDVLIRVGAIPLVRLGKPPCQTDYTPRTYGLMRRALRCVVRWFRRHIADKEK